MVVVGDGDGEVSETGRRWNDMNVREGMGVSVARKGTNAG